jgi:hypothetical protein
MAIHKKKDEGRAAARLLLESGTPIELPEAEINEEGITLEREEFRPHLPELLEELRDGCVVTPVPVVMSNSMFVIHADTRTFWVRLWHTDETRTQIDRLHVTSCMPVTRAIHSAMLRGAGADATGTDNEDDEQD